ncbi:head maturation protease [Pseudomonas phage Cassandra]|nr:head maturation protease [Pseudomonas phage Cassandra]
MARQLYEYMSQSKGSIIIEHGTGPDGARDLFMRGIFIQGDVKNHNQRIYPLHEISHAVESVKAKIQEGFSVLGELDHPEELTINLDRVSHIITEMWMEGNCGYGKLKLLDTPTGIIAKSLLTAGAKLGVSSRGSGNVGYDGVVSDFDIVTVDIVAQPSAPNAYPKPIYESLYNMKGGEIIMDLARNTRQDPSADKYLSREIIKLISELKK